MSGRFVTDDSQGVEGEMWKVTCGDCDTEELNEANLQKIVVNKPLNWDTQVHRDANYIRIYGETSWILSD